MAGDGQHFCSGVVAFLPLFVRTVSYGLLDRRGRRRNIIQEKSALLPARELQRNRQHSLQKMNTLACCNVSVFRFRLSYGLFHQNA
ncbi:hypothetical protein B0H19DRAFT_1171582 [Mycena capillaripes]|nr:hypothetical protein B0H19DRAFT_1171582 [Mycena capillaripes]